MSLVIDRNPKVIAQDAIHALMARPISKTMRYYSGMAGGVIPGKNGKSQNILPIQVMVSPSGSYFKPPSSASARLVPGKGEAKRGL